MALYPSSRPTKVRCSPLLKCPPPIKLDTMLHPIHLVSITSASYFLARVLFHDPFWPSPTSTTPPLPASFILAAVVPLPVLLFATRILYPATALLTYFSAAIAAVRFSRDAPSLRPPQPAPPLCSLFWRLDVALFAVAAFSKTACATALPLLVRVYAAFAAVFLVSVPFIRSLNARTAPVSSPATRALGLLTTALCPGTHGDPSPAFSERSIPPRPSKASLFSLLSFNWLSPLIATGHERPLHAPDLPHLRASFGALHAAEDASDGLAPHWAAELRAPRPRLHRALARAFGRRFFLAGLVRLANDGAVFVPPVMQAALTRFLQRRAAGEHVEDGSGLAMAFVMLAAYVALSLTFHHYMALNFAVLAQVRAALLATVFRKTCRLAPRARAAYSAGQIQNMMAGDTRAVADIVVYLHTLWSPVLEVTVALVLLVNLLGWVPTLAGMGCIIATVPIQTRLANLLKSLRGRVARRTDDRVKVLSEAVGSMKLVKLYAWEMSFVRRLLTLRGAELRLHRSMLFAQACASILSNGLPTVLSVVVFAVFAVLGSGPLDAATVFPAISLFAVISPGLNLFPRQVANVARSLASLDRLEDFLLADELQSLSEGRNAVDQDRMQHDSLDVAIEHASFSWSLDPSTRPTLADVCLSIPSGSLVAIVGATGAGKSTLLASLLGEVPITCGNAGLRDGRSVAFCAQVPFIQNATVRENILFGRPLDHKHYNETLASCCLGPDLEIFPVGDSTEIGTRGVSISGGQRARVSLARATYSHADIMLFDDPLSAVDAHVGRMIFKECIARKLEGHTRMLTMNQIHYATSTAVDIVVVVKDGKVVESGARADLMNSPSSEFSKMLESVGELGKPAMKTVDETQRKEDHHDDNQGPGPDVIQPQVESQTSEQRVTEKRPVLKPTIPTQNYGSMDAGRLTNAEKKSEGRVQWRHYIQYLRAMGVWQFVLPTILTLLFAEAASLSVNVWLSVWSEASQTDGGDTISVEGRLFVFILLGFLFVIFMGASGFLNAFGSIRASVSIHEKLLLSVFGATSSFFNSTPQGRLVNRFNSDVDKIDSQLAPTFASLGRTLLGLVSAVAINVWAAPHLIFLVVPIAICCVFLQDYLRKTVADLYILEAIARSPLYSHFSETLDGVMTIRAYNDVERAAHTSDTYTDAVVKTTYISNLVKRWMAVRVDTLCTAFIFSATLSAVLLPRGGVSASTLGLALSYTMQLIITLAFVVRYFTDVEPNMNAMERMVEYSEPPFPQEETGGLEDLLTLEKVRGPKLDVEKSRGVISPEKVQSLNNAVERHSSTWLTVGEVTFDQLEMRYKPELPPVLRGISFTALPGEHIGIVGRTGAGKSSAIQSLFRLYEPTDGRVQIDSLDISTMSLFDLRSSLGIIPQEAVCFSGTIQSNLDVFSEKNDAAVMRALHLCGLQDTMRDPVGLDFEIGENGSNLSVGQRQLLCLGRALLKGSRVLVLDEATSSVSNEVDEKIQQVLRSEMSQCTMLTVAHRLHTVMQSDRIIVMDRGRIAEIGRPAELLSRESMLGKLVDETGPSPAAYLRKLASQAQVTAHTA